MKRLFFQIGFLLVTLTLGASPTQAAGEGGSWHSCQIASGSSELKFRGSTLEEAMMRVTKACLDQQSQQYERQRGSLPKERAELFLESCVNLVQCARS